MKIPQLLLASLAVIPLVCNGTETTPSSNTTEEAAEVFKRALTSMEQRSFDARQINILLAKQAMLQQFNFEEKIRADGDSGIKVVRSSYRGGQNYYSDSHVGKNNFMAIHNHANYKNTIGMGEVVAILNGVEFRTRHNDYELVMPSTVSKEYHAVEQIPYPDVPPEVSSLENVTHQIAEMTEWFRAFVEQNTTHRNYTQYFKPVLCYMEGAWMADNETLEEPFYSPRHKIDASTWTELQEKIRYTSYSGSKHPNENLAYLPTTIMFVNETTGMPTYAQWNYRILCKPTHIDIPTKYFKQVDDLSFRYPNGLEMDDVRNLRAARFRLYEFEDDEFVETSLLDELFYRIPGKDNIVPETVTEFAFEEKLYKLGESVRPNVALNAAYYHRTFKFRRTAANGLKSAFKGFNDENMWGARTTQEKVAPIKSCERVESDNGNCTTGYIRYSWAIPLEIIYLTPLLTWNPYKLHYHESDTIPRANKRNGDRGKAFNGTFLQANYMTPGEFFGREETEGADSGEGSRYILDPSGIERFVKMSGTRVMLPDIGDLGRVRLRWPIAPVHGEGSSVWKELNALRDRTNGQFDRPASQRAVHFETLPSTNFGLDQHTHQFLVPLDTIRDARDRRKSVAVETMESVGHTHNLTVYFDINKEKYMYKTCDGQDKCWDGHPKELTVKLAVFVDHV